VSSSVGVDVRELFVLREETLVANEEPLADSHISFGLALSCCKAIVMKRKGRIKFASKRSQLVSRCHLQLSL